MIYKFLICILFPFSIKGQLSAINDDWSKNPSLKNASIAYCVINVANGERVSEYNSHQALVPASTLKILTTSAALGLLGNEFSYETKIYFTGNFDKNSGILNGDLIIYGSGDPTLQSEHFYKDSESVLLKWASVLKEKGLKEIKGKIIADASYNERRIPDNWIWEDISNYYGAVPCGLSYKDNKFKLSYSTGEKQLKAKLIAVSPDYFTQRLTIQSEVFANGTKDEAYAYGDPFSFSKEIRGTIPPNKKQYDIEVALPDPALLCAEHLAKALKQIGIRCDSMAVVTKYSKNEIPENKILMHTHTSPPLSKIVYYTNQNSNNHYCESILYTLGNGNAEKGLLKVKTYWQQQGLDTSEIYMEDASGLGRINTLTADFQAKALYTIAKTKNNYAAFNASLPLAGKQGSMSNLGKGTFIENNLRAKTGYMKRARAYCGYLKTKSGKELSFSLIFNNYACTASEAKKQMEKFLIGLAEL